MTAQQRRCEQVATAVVETIAQMAGAPGHPGLAAALAGVSETGTGTFVVAGVLYAHVAGSLERSAASYDRTGQAIIRQLPGVR
jgi:hypothetical protein